MRIPYDVVVIEADRLILRAVVSKTLDRAVDYWNQYLSYIESCGWTNREFDNETLRRVDAGWLDLLKRNWN